MDAPAPTKARSMALWLESHGLHHLAVAGLCATMATVLAGVAAALRTCDTRCTGWHVAAGILEVALAAALFLSFAFAGRWLADLTHHTWRERLGMRRKQLRLDDEDLDNLRRLEAVLDDAELVAIDHRARVHFWTGLLPGLAALLYLPFSFGAFGFIAHSGSFTLPLVGLCVVTASGATIRGALLLRGGRRVLTPRPEATPS